MSQTDSQPREGTLPNLQFLQDLTTLGHNKVLRLINHTGTKMHRIRTCLHVGFLELFPEFAFDRWFAKQERVHREHRKLGHQQSGKTTFESFKPTQIKHKPQQDSKNQTLPRSIS